MLTGFSQMRTWFLSGVIPDRGSDRASRGARHDRVFLAAMLLLSSVAALSLLAFRGYYSGRGGYSFMAWNLFLAWMPVAFAATAVSVRPGRPRDRAAVLGFGFLWLLFFPNAPYLCTEFIHLTPFGVSDLPLSASLRRWSPERPVPHWYDVMLVLSFAWNGLVLGFLSLYLVHRAVRERFGAGLGGATAAAASLLSGFGVSIGRFQRWNSWDLFSRPGALLSDVLGRVLNPLAHPRTTASTVLLASFLLLGYFTLLALMRLHGREGLRIED